MKYYWSILIVFLVGCGTLPKPSVNLGEKTCGPIAGTKVLDTGGNVIREGRMCHWKTCKESKGTLFYFHGLMESEQAPDATGSLFAPAHTEFTDLAVKRCLNIATVSWGTDPSFNNMYRPPGTTAQTPPSPPWAEVDKALDTVVESVKMPRPYIGYSTSMGGFNAATVANLKPSFFDKVILTHPVMTQFPGFPFAMAQLLIGTNFTPQEWIVANPMNTIKSVKAMPRMYVAACKTDEFGLYAGPKAYADTAKSRGFDVTFHEEAAPCKHTSIQLAPLMEWLDK